MCMLSTVILLRFRASLTAEKVQGFTILRSSIQIEVSEAKGGGTTESAAYHFLLIFDFVWKMLEQWRQGVNTLLNLQAF